MAKDENKRFKKSHNRISGAIYESKKNLTQEEKKENYRNGANASVYKLVDNLILESSNDMEISEQIERLSLFMESGTDFKWEEEISEEQIVKLKEITKKVLEKADFMIKAEYISDDKKIEIVKGLLEFERVANDKYNKNTLFVLQEFNSHIKADLNAILNKLEAKQDFSKTGTEKTTSGKIETEKAEPEKTEPKKTEPEKIETEPEKTELEKTESEKVEPKKTEPEKKSKKTGFKLAIGEYGKFIHSINKNQDNDKELFLLCGDILRTNFSKKKEKSLLEIAIGKIKSPEIIAEAISMLDDKKKESIAKDIFLTDRLKWEQVKDGFEQEIVDTLEKRSELAKGENSENEKKRIKESTREKQVKKEDVKNARKEGKKLENKIERLAKKLNKLQEQKNEIDKMMNEIKNVKELQKNNERNEMSHAD